MTRFAYTSLILLLFCAGIGWAQTDPFGETDTLTIESVEVAPGQTFSVNYHIYNDEELGAVTLPISYPSDKLDFVELAFTERLDYIGTKPVTIDETAGTILVGAVVIFEAYIAPGSGSVLTVTFKAKPDVMPGDSAILDSTTIGPAYLLLTYKLGDNIYPVFNRSVVTFTEADNPPAFKPVGNQYVAEGQELSLIIKAVDPEGGDVTLANPVHPFASSFVDHGDGTGTFTWRPDYIGPLSSINSPYELVFWASDGVKSSTLRFDVTVINVNRPPSITVIDSISGEAGDSVEVPFTVIDPDFDDVDWVIEGLPSGASALEGNPAKISWPSTFADSGSYTVMIIATDEYGLADTAQVALKLAGVLMYSLRIDTLTAITSEEISLEVYARNNQPIEEFDILIHFDKSVLTPLGVESVGTRSADLDFFTYRLDDNGFQGDIRIQGQAILADPIPSGEGVLFTLSMRVTSDLNVVGNQAPVRFVTRQSGDNTFVLDDETIIAADEINLFDGYVLIQVNGSLQLGDINLNQIAYEIADAVYFSNFYISPQTYPLDDIQLLNSDVNQDGLAPSIADLVQLINTVSGKITPVRKPRVDSPDAAVSLVVEQDGLYVVTESMSALGGLYVSLVGEDIDLLSPVNETAMDFEEGMSPERRSLLLVSYEGEAIESGRQDVIKLSDYTDLDVALEAVEAATPDGVVVRASKVEHEALPAEFILHQNEPNPFNPVTSISFDLSSRAFVTLTVYNVLGQAVVQLADEMFPAGRHEVIWDGLDARGSSVASGIYLYRLQAGQYGATRKMVLLK